MKWKENNNGQFENAPAGNFLARCYSLIDLGTQRHKGFQGEADRLQRDVRLSFELPTEKMEGKFDDKLKGKPFSVHVTVKQSLHPKSKLRKLLEGWRGRKFDKDSIEAFDPRKLICLPCRITLIENGDFVNIDSISPIGKSDKVPKQVNKSVYFSMENDEFDAETFKMLSEPTRKKIEGSPEYKAIAGGDDVVQDDSPEYQEGGDPDPDDGPQF